MNVARFAVLLAGIFAGSVLAQDGYPGKPIRILVGYAAGGGNDIIVRVMQPEMQKGLGQPVIVENKPGAQSIIAAELAARAPADGYTILLVTTTHTVNPGLVKKLPYDTIRDFAPISLAVSQPNILAVHPSVPAKSVKELVALARS